MGPLYGARFTFHSGVNLKKVDPAPFSPDRSGHPSAFRLWSTISASDAARDHGRAGEHGRAGGSRVRGINRVRLD